MYTFQTLLYNTLNLIAEGLILQKNYISILLVFIVIDIVTLIEISINRRKFNKRIYIKKVLTVISMLLVVLISSIIDICFATENITVSTAVSLFYLSQEGKCILNNAYTLGLPLPKILIKIIDQLDKNDNDSPSK